MVVELGAGDRRAPVGQRAARPGQQQGLAEPVGAQALVDGVRAQPVLEPEPLQLAHRARGEPVTAGLVAREDRRVGEHHLGAAARRPGRRGRPRGAGADDEDVGVGGRRGHPRHCLSRSSVLLERQTTVIPQTNRAQAPCSPMGGNFVLGLVVVLVVGEHPLLGVELAIGVVDLDVVGAVVGVEALLALLLDLLLVLRVGARLPGAVPLVVVGLVAVALVAVVLRSPCRRRPCRSPRRRRSSSAACSPPSPAGWAAGRCSGRRQGRRAAPRSPLPTRSFSRGTPTGEPGHTRGSTGTRRSRPVPSCGWLAPMCTSQLSTCSTHSRRPASPVSSSRGERPPTAARVEGLGQVLLQLVRRDLTRGAGHVDRPGLGPAPRSSRRRRR